MATKVHMEALSPTMEEGQLVRWLRAEGDAVSNGDVIAEIETDKATMELVARGDGILRKILLAAGGTAPVGEVIAVIAGADEDISSFAGGAGGGAAAPPAALSAERAAEPAAVGGAAAHEPEEDTPAPGAPTTEDGGRVKASPLARRLADDLGVNLSRVEGSGPGGRIVKRDVEAAKESGAAAPPPSQPAWTPDESEFADVPVSQLRQTIATRRTWRADRPASARQAAAVVARDVTCG